MVFALGGFLLSVAYTAPPLRLKKRGLGELDVLIVWGPLMVGGTYYAAVGTITWEVMLASLPYGLLCTAVLMGKHIDKASFDEPLGIRTLPVLLGEARSRHLTKAMMIAFYGLVIVCVAVGGNGLAVTRGAAGSADTGEGIAGFQPTRNPEFRRKGG